MFRIWVERWSEKLNIQVWKRKEASSWKCELVNVLFSSSCCREGPTNWVTWNKNLWSHSSKGYKSKIMVSSDHAPFEEPRMNLSLPLPGSGGPRHSLACDYVIPISASVSMLTFFVVHSASFLITTPNNGFRAYPKFKKITH